MTDTMRAVVITGYGGKLTAADRPVPEPGPGEVLVKVGASGLCSTDIHLLSGRMPLGDLPRVVGHETAGEVVGLGDGVSGWKIGDRVVLTIDVTCGHCRHCLAGDTHLCPSMKRIGFERDGGHADYVAVPTNNLVALPDTIPFEEAAILPDAVACTYHSLINKGRVGIGQRVLILGVGGLGIHGVQIARAAGAEVMATSRQKQRLDLAEYYGAVAVNTGRDSLKDTVADFTGGEGVDVVADNIGTRASIQQGLSMLRPGGKLLVIAYIDETFEVPSIPLFKTELEIIGCRGSTKQDLIDVVRLVDTGRLKPVLGASYTLDTISDAVARLESGDLVGRIWLGRNG